MEMQITYFALLLPFESRGFEDPTELVGLKSSAALPAVLSVTTLSDRLRSRIFVSLTLNKPKPFCDLPLPGDLLLGFNFVFVVIRDDVV